MLKEALVLNYPRRRIRSLKGEYYLTQAYVSFLEMGRRLSHNSSPGYQSNRRLLKWGLFFAHGHACIGL